MFSVANSKLPCRCNFRQVLKLGFFYLSCSCGPCYAQPAKLLAVAAADSVRRPDHPLQPLGSTQPSHRQPQLLLPPAAAAAAGVCGGLQSESRTQIVAQVSKRIDQMSIFVPHVLIS